MGRFIALAAVLAFLVVLARPALAADVAYEKGVAYLRAGKAAEAVEILAPLAKERPGDPYVLYHLGLAYYKAGRLDEAVGAFDGVRATGKAAPGEFRLGVAYLNAGIGYFRGREYDKSAAALDTALSVEPDEADAHYYLGLVAVERGQYDRALESLSRARGLKAADPAALAAISNAVGMTYARQDDNLRAIDEFKKTIEIDPGNIEALYQLGILNYKERGYAYAGVYFDRLAAKAGGDERTKKLLLTTFFNMGVDFQDRGKADLAAEMFGRALEIAPADPEARYYRGYNLMELGRFEDAYAEFKAALESDPGSSKAKAQLEVAGKFAAEAALKDASAAMGRGEFYAALPLYTKALSFDPSSEAARRGRSEAAGAVRKDASKRAAEVRASMKEGRYAEARLRARAFSELDPGSAEAASLVEEVEAKAAAVAAEHEKAGAAAEKRQALGEAAAHYEKAAELFPGGRAAGSLSRVRSAVKDERAQADKALSEGRLAAARKGYERLLVYLPGDAGARRGLDEVKERVGIETRRLLTKAEEFYGAGDYDMAAYHVTRALELTSSDPAALKLRARIKEAAREEVARHVEEGNGYLSQGKPDMAAKSFREALKLDPDSAEAARGLERTRSAAPEGEAGAELRALYLKGVEHYTAGELDEAVAAWREVLRLDPGNEKAMNNIKRAEEKMKQAGQAP